jgi:hypothetical protein
VGTTDGRLAVLALDAMTRAGVRFAVLHDEERLALGNVSSDVDLAVDRPGRDVIREALGALHDVGLHPVVLWPYGVDALTVFLATGTASDAVQLDMTYDPDGRGKYGIRTDVALDVSVPGKRFPRLPPDHELLYLVSKRKVKRDPQRLAPLIDRARHRKDTLIQTAQAFLGRRTAADVIASILDAPAARERRAYVGYEASEMLRKLVRMAYPAGFWVEVIGDGSNGPAAAEQLATRFGGFLDDGAFYATRPISPASRAAQVAWWLRHIAPVQLRAAFVVSHADQRLRPHASFAVPLSRGGPDELARAVVNAMEARCLSRLRHVRPSRSRTTGR